MFNLTGKITAQRYTRGVSSLPAARPIPQDRVPDWVTEEQTSTGQALIYRLSGDYNPLRVGPGCSLILHGLSTLGFAARVLVRMVGHGRPSSLRGYLNVKFTAPVAPGDGLETSALNVGTGDRSRSQKYKNWQME